MRFLETVDVKLRSVGLEGYYSESSYVSRFDGDTTMYIVPKRNATLNGSQRWKDLMREFVADTPHYLEEHYKGKNSETGFFADKRMFGWGIAQRREDRIDGALFCTGLWHNLLNLGPA